MASFSISPFGTRIHYRERYRPALCNRPDHECLILVLELQAIERSVAAALAQQLLVPAGFDDRAALDHENAIGVHDRLQTMGDDQRDAALAQAAHGILDPALGFAVERCGRLVEQD